MADTLTQLQDCLDDLLELMHKSLNYIQTRHPYGEIAGQPSQAPEPEQPKINGASNTNAQQEELPSTPPPETAERFNNELHSFASDLVTKQQMMEIIIESLPGVGHDEAEQERQMRELEVKLRRAEEERTKAEEEREKMVDLLGQVIVGAKRAP